jgi:hypothetical protein
MKEKKINFHPHPCSLNSKKNKNKKNQATSPPPSTTIIIIKTNLAPLQ